MYLIDTSIWIDYFREKNNPKIDQFKSILDEGMPIGITGIIYQEILQGAETINDFHQLVIYLSTIRFFHPLDNILSYQSAAKLYFDCRKKGVTLRSTIDCLIAQVAIEHQLTLLHNDHDYERIKKIAPKLKTL
jgi:predicted nucleic acid-binding protein